MNKNPDVDTYLTKKAHPRTAEIERVREIILSAHEQIEETIKWNSPTFMYKGNMASFFMNAKKHVSVMFHKGAYLPNPTGLLEGDGKEGRTVRFANLEEIELRKEDLKTVVLSWVHYRDETK